MGPVRQASDFSQQWVTEHRQIYQVHVAQRLRKIARPEDGCTWPVLASVSNLLHDVICRTYCCITLGSETVAQMRRLKSPEPFACPFPTSGDPRAEPPAQLSALRGIALMKSESAFSAASVNAAYSGIAYGLNPFMT
jgi:hypothetical protein